MLLYFVILSERHSKIQSSTLDSSRDPDMDSKDEMPLQVSIQQWLDVLAFAESLGANHYLERQRSHVRELADGI